MVQQETFVDPTGAPPTSGDPFAAARSDIQREAAELSSAQSKAVEIAAIPEEKQRARSAPISDASSSSTASTPGFPQRE